MQKLLTSIFICLTLLAFNNFGQSQTRKTKISSLNAAQAETLEQKIVRISSAYRIDPRLFHSLIYAESSFKMNALSYKGAGCLTQLMPATARRFGLIVNSQIDERFSNLEKCLDAGARYLAFLLNTFKGDVRLALAGYNAGEGAVMKFGWRIPPYRETVQYVEKICALYYGQSGHGVAMAYNQPLAQSWTNTLYQTWRVRSTAKITTANPQFQLIVPTTGETEAAQEKTEPKKTVVTRVQISEPNTKLRTESLSFH